MSCNLENAFALLSEYALRTFILGGRTKDHFMLADGRYLRFELVLHEYLLRELKYEAVAFIDHQGLFFWDARSAQLLMTPKSVKGKLAKPPGAGILMKRERGMTTRVPESKGTSVLTCKLRYDFGGDATELMTKVMQLLNGDVQVAVVVVEFSLLFNISSGNNVARVFGGFLRDQIVQLPALRRNILVFLSSSDNSRDLASRFREVGLEDLYFESDGGEKAGRAGISMIGYAGREECLRLLTRWRVVEHKHVDLATCEPMSVLMSSWLKENNRDLHALYAKCSTREVLDIKNIESLLELKRSKSAHEMLHEMVGLEEVKKNVQLEVDSMVPMTVKPGLYPARLGVQTESIEASPYMNHFALLGNPGTGKTTVARIIGRLLQERGILDTGHFIQVGRSDLVAEHVGGTAPKTREAIERAIGGVLFIDEAYSLYQDEGDPFGKECIAVLIEAMSSLRGRFVVILAGYPREMRDLLNANPGFLRRVKVIDIPDYSDDELAEIMRRMLWRDQCDPFIMENTFTFVKNLLTSRAVDANWGNAGEVEKIVEDARKKCRARRGQFLEVRDFENAEYFQQSVQSRVLELADCIGMQDLKDHLRRLESTVWFRKSQGKSVDPGHYLFIGNPGTGKTTGAEMMAREFYKIGLLRTPKCFSITASELIGQYLGTSENRTRDVFQKALGGVLFIDEAHQLAGQNSYSYGQQIINTLIPLMENHRDEVCVIFAGYPAPMERLLAADSGMSSRVKNRVNFADYTDEELLEIFRMQYRRELPQVPFPEELAPDILNFFDRLRRHEGPHFGNARSVRNYLEKVIEYAAHRCHRTKDEMSITREDILLARKEFLHDQNR